MFSSRPAGRRASRLRLPPVGALTFGTLAVLALLTAAIWALHSQRFFRRTLRAPGRVVGIYARSTHDSRRRSSVSYSPVVRFLTAEGREVRFTGLGSDPASYRAGDAVTVLYHAARPQDARIQSFQELWLGPACFAGFVLLFALVSLLLARMRM
jgi:hypothetical protein